MDFVERLARARIGETYNQYAGSAQLCERLGSYLEARRAAEVVLVGEAAGYRGARVSGIPFTSERQLTGSGPAEATATIVHRVLAELGVEDEVLLWNVVPTHPGSESSNRRPTRERGRGGLPVPRRAGPRSRRNRRRQAGSVRPRRAVRPPSVARRRGRVRGWIAPVIRYNRPPAGTCPPLSMKTYSAKPGEITREWYLVDAEGKTLGRLATQIADTLRGKRKPQYTPHVDTGDFVIVVNAEKIHVTGNKLDQKRYYRHSGYPGGLRSRTLREQLDRRPTEVLRVAVKGMLPKNRLARQQITKLKIYAGPEHPHEAQNPKPLEPDQ